MDLLNTSKPYDFDRVMRALVTIGLVVGGYLLAAYLAEVLIPFGVAFVLAYLLNPVAVFFQQKVKNRLAAVGITLFLFLAVVALVSVFLVWSVGQETVRLASFVKRYGERGSAVALRAREILPPALHEPLDEFLHSAALRDFLQSEQFRQILIGAAKQVAPGLWQLAGGALGFLLGLVTIVVVLMYLAFLLLDYQRFEATWKDFLPPRRRRNIVEFLRDFNGAMRTYFRGQALIAAAVGFLFATGFSLLGLPMAVPLGLFLGLLNMVPYLQIVGLVPASLMAVLRALETGGGLGWYLAAVLLVFAVVQLIQEGVLTPWVIGEATGLRPAVIMLAVFVWGKLLGFLGVVLAIPLTCLLFTYYSRYLKQQRFQMNTATALESAGPAPEPVPLTEKKLGPTASQEAEATAKAGTPPTAGSEAES